METLIFCNQNDAIAFALYQQLLKMGKNTSLITAEELQYATSWIHELDSMGNGFTEIKLQNGNTIHSGEIKAVWNRIRYFPMMHFLNETDRYYAQNEMSALYFSFLKSINNALINPIEVYDLAVQEYNLLYLKHQANLAGLPVTDHHFTTSPRWQSSLDMIPMALQKKSSYSFNKKAPYLVWQNQPALFTETSGEQICIWIVGGEIIGEVSKAQKKSLKKLSENLKKTFLEIHFAKTLKGCKVSFINTFPEFAPLKVIDSLLILLTQKNSKEK
jgi:hypothetical protein